ncbi:MAG: addiction module protein [Kiritimatiellae bacterium]|nr:addiction module protein [Kiritimatiellia bacterium]MCO5068722.1 addiction module protein [Kiritimatiellia bacterium]
MTKATHALMNEALALPPVERASLIEGLISSFDPEGRAAIDRAWAREAEMRIEAYDSGKARAKPLKSVLRRVNNR